MRTEEQKLVQDPIMVTLGGKEYEIKVLTIAESRAWKRKFVELSRNSFTQIQTKEPGEFGTALLSLLVDAPDMFIDLFFSYARDLPRDEIEQTATESEIAVAWEAVREVAFPLTVTLVKTMNKLLP